MLLIFACFVGTAICLCRRNQPNGSNNGSVQNNNGGFTQAPRELKGKFIFKTVNLFNLFISYVSNQSQHNEWIEAFDVAT
jgi:hypothetical protein